MIVTSFKKLNDKARENFPLLLIELILLIFVIMQDNEINIQLIYI